MGNPSISGDVGGILVFSLVVVVVVREGKYINLYVYRNGGCRGK